MEFTAKQIAELIGGRVEGDENVTVSSFAKIEEGHEGAISFLSNPKYQHYLYETQSSVVLVNEDVQLERAVKPTLIRVRNAYESVARLMQVYESMKPRKRGVDTLAVISPSAVIGNDVYIGPFAFVGDGAVIDDGAQIYTHAVVGDNVRIGSDCLIYPNVTIYPGCRLGKGVIVHSGAVIGADGFGFAPNDKGYEKIPQIGIVVIEDNVEIGANTCIDRSTMGETRIRRGVKIDNLVQVAHNCEIGENTVISAQTGIAGSTKVGAWCMLGGQVGLAGHLSIGDRVFLGAQSGVPSSLKGNQTLIGTPPMEPTGYFKSQAIFRRLPEMYRELNELRKELDELKGAK